MTTFIQKKTRLFLDRGDIKAERRRSEARLKTYPSSIDVRAWCDIVEDRRQHILELVYKERGKCLGNLLPLEAIIDALVAGRVADIQKIKKCLIRLWKFIESLNLSKADKKKLAAMKLKMDPICASGEAGDQEEGQGAQKDSTEDVIVFDLDKGGLNCFKTKTDVVKTTKVYNARKADFAKKDDGKHKEGDSDSDVDANLEQQPSESPEECVAKERHEKELAEVEALLEDDKVGSHKSIVKGPGKVTTRVKGFRQAMKKASGKLGGAVTTRAQGPAKFKNTVKGALPKIEQSGSQIKSPSSQIQSGEKQRQLVKQSTQEQPQGKTQSHLTEDKASPHGIQEKVQSQSGHDKTESNMSQQGKSQSQTVKEKTKGKVLQQIQNQLKKAKKNKSKEKTESHTSQGKSRSHTSGKESQMDSNQYEAQLRSYAIPEDFECDEEISDEQIRSITEFTPLLDIQSSAKDADIRVQLYAREALCNELQSTLESIKNERDNFRKQFEAALEELSTVKKLNIASSIIPTSCQDEIDALELEIKVMRSGNLSPEQEAEVIKKEVDVLKKYCMKLKSVEDENEKLRLERDTLKSQVKLGGDVGNETHKSAKDNLNRQVAGIIDDSEKYVTETSEVGSKENLPHTDELNNKLKHLEEITRERDVLANKVQRLEKELLQYRDLPEDIDVYKNRSKMLDCALEERDKMAKKVEQIKDMEDELNQLRRKSSKMDELQEELKLVNKNDKNIGSELKRVTSKSSYLENELKNVKMERDSMRTRIEHMKKEIETLRTKGKEAEMFRLERDKLQIKLNELSHIQVEYENLMLKCKSLESAVAEKDMYKQKYEQLVAMQSHGGDMLRSQAESTKNIERERNSLVRQVGDLECCICDQEEEIKKLVMQIDHLCRSKDENQCRMREALANMRAEIEKKDCLIAESEEKLAAVQAQLKSSIQGVSCETTCYKTRIEDLERELHQCQSQIRILLKQLAEKGTSLKGVEKLTKTECQSVAAMKQELDAAKEENKKLREIANKMVAVTGDEHVQSMLKQSQCAVKRVVEELSRQYKEWDKMKRNQKKGIYAHVNKQCPCLYQSAENQPMSDSESNEKIVQELEDIQREKKKLEELVKQIHNDKLSDSQNELILLRMDNDKLRDQLHKEVNQRKELERKFKITT